MSLRVFLCAKQERHGGERGNLALPLCRTGPPLSRSPLSVADLLGIRKQSHCHSCLHSPLLEWMLGICFHLALAEGLKVMGKELYPTDLMRKWRLTELCHLCVMGLDLGSEGGIPVLCSCCCPGAEQAFTVSVYNLC